MNTTNRTHAPSHLWLSLSALLLIAGCSSQAPPSDAPATHADAHADAGSTANLGPDAGAITYTCNSTTGLTAGLEPCTQTAPCPEAVIFADGGVVRTTMTTPTEVPSCSTTVAWRAPKFNDGEPDEWQDPDGVPRYTCIYRPPGASPTSTRPLVLYFHGTGGLANNVYNYSRLRAKAINFDLTGEPARPGFILASIQGRNLHWPTMHGDGPHHDYYYRAGTNNLDVVNADRVITQLIAEGIVDTKRIYVVGWSNGATFGQFYALLRHETAAPSGPKVAAAAFFAFANPYHNLSLTQQPSCELDPYPTSQLPMYMLNRACDSLTACGPEQEQAFALPPGHAATVWVSQLATKVGNPNVTFRIINGQGIAVRSCTSTTICTKEAGTAAHLLWPDGVLDGSGNDWEPHMLGFLKANPLP